MNTQQVIFGFFVLLAATFNFDYLIGDLTDPGHHHIYELFAALLISIVATALKLRDRTQLGGVHLATSLVADLQLVLATCYWAYAAYVSPEGLTGQASAVIVSLSGGALLANIVSVTLLVIETARFGGDSPSDGPPAWD
jgi:hypothetical protein